MKRRDGLRLRNRGARAGRPRTWAPKTAPVRSWATRAGRARNTSADSRSPEERAGSSRVIVAGVIVAAAVAGSLVIAVSTSELATAMNATDTTRTASAQAAVRIASGATWEWRYSSDPLPDDWNTVEDDAPGWITGPGVLGRGVAGETTNIDPTSLPSKPISAQFRKTFTVAEADDVQDGTVSVIADDGVVVYLNGKELGRANLPDGPVTQDTLATSAVQSSTAAENRFTFRVPSKLLVDGTNVIAASVHANYPNTPDLSFDLTLKMPRG